MTAAGSSLKERVAKLFADELHVDVPATSTDLLATARLDSLGVVELIVQIEKQFEIRIELEDLELENFRSIDSIAALIGARLSNAGASSGTR
jgi:methoxymalonate biosynthesis acyl carrier protein